MKFLADMGPILALSHADLPSVIIFRLSDETPSSINSHLKTIFESQSEVLIKGSIIIAEDSRYRIRLLPI